MARPGLDRNVKFRRLCRELQEPRPHVRGYLEHLWDVAYENGEPIIGDERAVEAAAEFPGTPGRLFDALMTAGGDGRVGFIEPTPDRPGVYQVHDLFDHAPDYVKKRRQREGERRDKTADNGGQRRPLSDNGAPPTPTPTPTPTPSRGMNSPSTPSCPEPEEPARGPTATDEPSANETPPHAGVNPRSGKQRDHGGDDAPDQAASLDSAGDPVLLSFPVVGGKRGKGPAEWPLRASKVSEYSESFPGVDILAECRRALQWCRDNPSKRKTPRGMNAFLSRWLGNAQDFPAKPLRRTTRSADRMAGVRELYGDDFDVRSTDPASLVHVSDDIPPGINSGS